MNIIRLASRWLRRVLGNESRLISLLLPAVNLALDVTSLRRGIWLQVNGHEWVRVDPWYRHHFPEHKDSSVCAFLRNHVRTGDLCINLGAHVGFYAIPLAQWCGPSGRVIAFEPNPETRRILLRHIAMNSLASRIELRPEAASNGSGSATFYPTGLEGTSRLGSPNPVVAVEADAPVSVSTVSVDGFCMELGIVPDWLLVDVEGYEVHVLQGARETVRASKGRIGLIFEMHPSLWPSAGSNREDLERCLNELGLCAMGLESQSDPLGEHGIVHLVPSSGGSK